MKAALAVPGTETVGSARGGGAEAGAAADFRDTPCCGSLVLSMADSTGSDDAVAGGRKNTIWGVEPSLVSDEELFTRVDSVVVSRATNEAIADRVTFSVIHRIRERIRHLIQTEACKMALQTGLALVVMDVIGAFPPCDLGDVEKVGNHIALQLTRRYVDQIKKIKRNVRKPEARAAQLQQLEAECWVPAGMWTVPSKTQPRLRDSQVGRWDVSIESDMKMVLEENVQLKILAASAEHYAIRSEQSRERCTVEEARAREANLRASHAQQYLQEANDGLARERHRLQAAETKKRAALDRCKQAKAEVTRLQGRIAHLGGCVSRAVAEAGAEKRARDMLESDKQGDLERKVRQRVEEQVREELSAELKAAEAEVARMARLKNDMAKRKRSSDARARTSEKRLEARKVAEETVKHLRDELDGLYEDLRAAEEQARAAGLRAAIQSQR